MVKPAHFLPLSPLELNPNTHDVDVNRRARLLSQGRSLTYLGRHVGSHVLPSPHFASVIGKDAKSPIPCLLIFSRHTVGPLIRRGHIAIKARHQRQAGSCEKSQSRQTRAYKIAPLHIRIVLRTNQAPSNSMCMNVTHWSHSFWVVAPTSDCITFTFSRHTQDLSLQPSVSLKWTYTYGACEDTLGFYSLVFAVC